MRENAGEKGNKKEHSTLLVVKLEYSAVRDFRLDYWCGTSQKAFIGAIGKGEEN